MFLQEQAAGMGRRPGGGVGHTRRVVLMATMVAAAASAPAWADPTPSSGGWLDGTVTLLQTIELVWQSELALSGSGQGAATGLIFYGGPSLVYNVIPGEDDGPGAGLEAGVELRRNLFRCDRGLFTGVYAGYGVQWPIGNVGADHVSAFSAGVKAGLRIRIGRGSPGFDAEPYGAWAWAVTTSREHLVGRTSYLGIKLEFH